jgi:hypothetical protein
LGWIALSVRWRVAAIGEVQVVVVVVVVVVVDSRRAVWEVWEEENESRL